jgi:hypothetical protein
MKTLLLLGAGALVLYLTDREQGAQRRAQLREKLDRAKQMIRERSSRTAPQPKDYAPERDMPERAHL